MRIRYVLLLLALLVASRVSAQAGAGIELVGPKGEKVTLTAAALEALPQRDVRASAHGVEGVFSGASLADVVKLVGAPSGDSLRGPALASYVLVEARDGYRVTFTLAEFNSTFTDRVILVADRRDGKVLADTDGPIQIVVPDEKRPARWIRQVQRITVVVLPASVVR